MGYKEFFYIKPKYYNKFKCICGDCQMNCCDKGWKIYWKKDEHINLLESSSGELLERIKESFVPIVDPNGFVIKLCEDGDCPFHNRETGLCDIQKENGENALGDVCRQYPRIGNAGYNILRQWCTASCPAVVDLLIDDADAVLPEVTIKKDQDKFIKDVLFVCNYDSEKVLSDNPIVKYRFDILDLFTEILNYKDRSIEDSIVLGAIAAKHISAAAEKKDFDSIPDIIEKLRPQLNDPHAADSLADIKPNYQLKFKLVNNMIVRFWDNDIHNADISVLHDGNELIVDNYISGMKNFNAAFKDKDYVLRNIIINTFYELKAPIEKLERTIFDNYGYFVVCAAVLQTIAAAVGFQNDDVVNKFRLAVAEICCGFSHYDIKEVAVIDDMKNEGLTSPAHLALIIK